MDKLIKPPHQGFQTPFDSQLDSSWALVGSPGLYAIVRAGFITQGTSLNKWCIGNGLNRYTVERALKGETTTKAALALVARLVVDAGYATSPA